MNKKVSDVKRCIKCNYFDAMIDYDHCQKCFPIEMESIVKQSNCELFKKTYLKNFFKEVN